MPASGCNRAGQADDSDQVSPPPAQGAQSARSGASLLDERDVVGGDEAQAEPGREDDAEAEEEAPAGAEDEEAGEDNEDQAGDGTADEEDDDESADEDDGGNDGGGEADPGDEEQPETGNGDGDEGDGEQEEAPREPDPNIDAAAIYKSALCGQCHGDDYLGTPSGPSLLNMGDYWNAENLAQFLKSPMRYSEGNRRLVEIGRRYPVLMPPTHRNDEELFALAWWLIELEQPAAD